MRSPPGACKNLPRVCHRSAGIGATDAIVGEFKFAGGCGGGDEEDVGDMFMVLSWWIANAFGW
jgi:hypothetical protein